jgi:xylan 1,4-beta-xylosidase
LGGIKKPTFYAFEFFSRAGKELLYRDDHLIVTKRDDSYVIIGFNWHDMRDHQPSPDETYTLSLPSLGQQALLVKKTWARPRQSHADLEQPGKPRTSTRSSCGYCRLPPSRVRPIANCSRITACMK